MKTIPFGKDLIVVLLISFCVLLISIQTAVSGDCTEDLKQTRKELSNLIRQGHGLRTRLLDVSQKRSSIRFDHLEVKSGLLDIKSRKQYLNSAKASLESVAGQIGCKVKYESNGRAMGIVAPDNKTPDELEIVKRETANSWLRTYNQRYDESNHKFRGEKKLREKSDGLNKQLDGLNKEVSLLGQKALENDRKLKAKQKEYNRLALKCEQAGSKKGPFRTNPVRPITGPGANCFRFGDDCTQEAFDQFLDGCRPIRADAIEKQNMLAGKSTELNALFDRYTAMVISNGVNDPVSASLASQWKSRAETYITLAEKVKGMFGSYNQCVETCKTKAISKCRDKKVSTIDQHVAEGPSMNAMPAKPATSKDNNDPSGTGPDKTENNSVKDDNYELHYGPYGKLLTPGDLKDLYLVLFRDDGRGLMLSDFAPIALRVSKNQELWTNGERLKGDVGNIADLPAKSVSGNKPIEVNYDYYGQRCDEEDVDLLEILGPGGSNTPEKGASYSDGHRGKVYLPMGDISFADEVVSFIEGDPAYKDEAPWHALERPDRAATILGCGGVLTLQFIDNALRDIEGTDLYVFEVGPDVEPTFLSISKDGEEWIEIGKISGGRADIDISEFVVPGDLFHYVRLRDGKKSDCGGQYPGADIDAVGAIGSVPINEEDYKRFEFTRCRLEVKPGPNIHLVRISYDFSVEKGIPVSGLEVTRYPVPVTRNDRTGKFDYSFDVDAEEFLEQKFEIRFAEIEQMLSQAYEYAGSDYFTEAQVFSKVEEILEKFK